MSLHYPEPGRIREWIGRQIGRCFMCNRWLDPIRWHQTNVCRRCLRKAQP